MVTLPISTQSIDAHNGEARLLLCVAAQVQVHHLLHHDVLGFDCLCMTHQKSVLNNYRKANSCDYHDHVGEQARHIDAERHVGDHLLDDFSLLLHITLYIYILQELADRERLTLCGRVNICIAIFVIPA